MIKKISPTTSYANILRITQNQQNILRQAAKLYASDKRVYSRLNEIINKDSGLNV